MTTTGLRGFKGQRMAGQRVLISDLIAVYDFTTTGAQSFVAPKDCWAVMFAFGAGAGSGPSIGQAAGGGGGAAKRRFFLAAGQTVNLSVGAGGIEAADGEDTTVTLPDGSVWGARGGKSGNGLSGGAGFGVVEVSRRGGDSRAATSAATQNGLPSPDTGGGTPGAGEYNPGAGRSNTGGSAGAGFSDLGAILKGGNGGNGSNGVGANGTQPGGGGGSSQLNTTGSNGGAGRFFAYLIRDQ